MAVCRVVCTGEMYVVVTSVAALTSTSLVLYVMWSQELELRWRIDDFLRLDRRPNI